MSPVHPMYFTWDGEALVPRSARAADEQFVIGQVYRMTELEERSGNSHRHQFAWLKEAWKQLPENLAELYPSPEHLRKRALIDAGFYHEQIVDCSTDAAALRVASSFRARDDFLLVIVRGPAVVIREAKSQSARRMDHKEFQASKTGLMEVISAMIGVTPEQLTQESGRAA
jgi:hypothetical protein